MEMLTSDALDRARSFVLRSGRRLERARFAHLVDGGSLEDVAGELTAFQVEGGGFGGALESDARTPAASVLATLTTLDILRMHGAPGDHPLSAGACAWLVQHAQTNAADQVVWPFLPPQAQAAPHAPWWYQSEPGQLAETFNGFLANPGLAITAHLWRYAAAAPQQAADAGADADLLARLGTQARAIAGAGFAAEEVNAHDAAAHLVGEPAVPDAVRGELLAYLTEVLPQRIMRTEADFTTYGIHPLWVAPSPTHPLARVVAPQVEIALDHVIRTQQADGSWQPFWDWGGWFPQEWEVAAREWQGSLVVRNIAALKAWGRVGKPDADSAASP